jgi:hypothetical protein
VDNYSLEGTLTGPFVFAANMFAFVLVVSCGHATTVCTFIGRTACYMDSRTETSEARSVHQVSAAVQPTEQAPVVTEIVSADLPDDLQRIAAASSA